MLAREANLVVRDEAFARELRGRLEDAIEHASTPIHAEHPGRRDIGTRFVNAVSYAVMRFAVSLSGVTGRY